MVPQTAEIQGLFRGYREDGFYDEMFLGGKARAHCSKLYRTLNALSSEEFRARCELADLTLINQGITFTVYSDNQGTERIFPFDLIPRIIPRDEWEHVERGRGLPHRLAAVHEGVVDLIDDLVIHRAAKLRMRVQHDADRRILLPRRVIAAFYAAGGPRENNFGHL